MNKSIKWPMRGGCSLLLALPEVQRSLVDQLADELHEFAAEFGVAVSQGTASCDALVRSCIQSLSWLDPDSVFVFRCPHDLPVWEAAPLVALGTGEVLFAQIAKCHFGTRCAAMSMKRLVRWRPTTIAGVTAVRVDIAYTPNFVR